EFGVRPEVREAPYPEPAPDGVVIEVEATGVCRSDWHRGQGCHAGDRVTLPFVCAAGSCAECASGNQQICDRQFQPGATHWGSFAEFVAVDYAETNLAGITASPTAPRARACGRGGPR